MRHALPLLIACVAGCTPPTLIDAGTDAGADSGVRECSGSAECDDGLFCNGAEACDPSATGADARGCVAGVGPCASPGDCDEAGGVCRACGSPDMDGDGHGRLECGGDDCDDGDADRFPGNIEICDSDDEDCDSTTFGELDGDGDERTSSECCNGDNCGPDCDDSNPAIGLLFEICDEVDNDCDELVDENTSAVDWFPDTDADGFGDPNGAPVQSCTVVPGSSVIATDCDDTDPAIRRGAIERCNGRDDDCDEQIDEGDCVDGGVAQADAGAPDAGPRDAGPGDAGAMDAGAMDAGSMDAGPIDAGCMPAVLGSSNLGSACFQ